MVSKLQPPDRTTQSRKTGRVTHAAGEARCRSESPALRRPEYERTSSSILAARDERPNRKQRETEEQKRQTGGLWFPRTPEDDSQEANESRGQDEPRGAKMEKRRRIREKEKKRPASRTRFCSSFLLFFLPSFFGAFCPAGFARLALFRLSHLRLRP